MNVEKFKLLEKIKESYLKNRGSVLAVASELKLDLEYTRKMVSKFKKKDKRDVSVLVADSLMEHILLGYKSRVQHLMLQLKRLENRDFDYVCIKCGGVLQEEEVEGGVRYKCVHCDDYRDRKLVDKEKIHRLKLEIIDKLRLEDEALTKFADTMGYTDKEVFPPAPVQKTTNYQVVVDGESKKIVQDVAKLDPMDRYLLAQDIRKKFDLETDKKDDKEKKVKGGEDDGIAKGDK